MNSMQKKKAVFSLTKDLLLLKALFGF